MQPSENPKVDPPNVGGGFAGDPPNVGGGSAGDPKVDPPNVGGGSAGDPHAVLRCRGLIKRYQDVVAVNGLDLEVLRGECFGLLGPNGAGKTTTVEILEGLTRQDGGSVHVLGQRWTSGDDIALRARIGIQLQETQLADKLTVAETIRLFRSFYPRGRTVDQVMDLMGMQSKRNARVHKLSGGQRQRLALACALVSEPEVLFLDEPTTGLDPQARHRIWEVIETFRANGGTALLTTHYMDEAARLCDRVAIMDHGRIIEIGTPEALVASLGADQIVEFRIEGSANLDKLRELPDVRSVSRREEDIVLAVGHIGTALPALLDFLQESDLVVERLTTHQPTLEDVFVSLTGRGLRDE